MGVVQAVGAVFGERFDREYRLARGLAGLGLIGRPDAGDLGFAGARKSRVQCRGGFAVAVFHSGAGSELVIEVGLLSHALLDAADQLGGDRSR